MENNKVLLNSTNNYIQYPITNIIEKNILKECIYIYIYIYIYVTNKTVKELQ